MNYFRSLFPETGFAANVVRLGGGTAAGQAIVVLSTPAITRLYTPDDMGLLGLVVAFVGVAGIGCGLRYELAIVSAGDEGEADRLLSASLLLLVPTSILSGFLLLAMIRWDVLSYGKLPLWSVAATVAILAATGMFLSLRYWFVRRTDFSGIGRALILQGVGRSVAPILAGLAQAGWAGLLLGEVAGRAFGIGRLLRRALPAVRRALLPFRPADIVEVLRRNWKFPAVVLPSSLLDALAAGLPLPILSSLFGVDKAGLFLLVMRIGTLPSALVSASVADVFHSRISEAYRSDRLQVPSIIRNTAKKLGALGLAVYLPVALASPIFLDDVLGGNWGSAGILMAILSPLAMVSLVVSPLSRLLLVVKRFEVKLVSDVGLLCVPLVGLYGTWRLGYGFRACMISYAAMYVAADLFYLLLILGSADAGTRNGADP